MDTGGARADGFVQGSTHRRLVGQAQPNAARVRARRAQLHGVVRRLQCRHLRLRYAQTKKNNQNLFKKLQRNMNCSEAMLHQSQDNWRCAD